MADVPETDIKNLEDLNDVLKEVKSTLQDVHTRQKDVVRGNEDLAKSAKKSADAKEEDIEVTKKAAGELQRLQEAVSSLNMNTAIQSFSNFVTTTKSAITNARESMTKEMKQMMDSINDTTIKGSKETTDILSALVPLSVSKMHMKLTQMKYKIPLFDEIETSAMSAERTLMNLTIPFSNIRGQLRDLGDGAQAAGIGSIFTEAQGSVREFNAFLSKTIQDTQQGQKEVEAVATALGKTFGPEAFRNFNNIKKSIDGFNSNMNQVTAVLQIANATGSSNSQIVSLMEQAYLDLGHQGKETLTVLGSIYDAATRSKLGFDRTSKSIMESASMLKFFGGTVDSMVPLFNTFAQSLSGIGKVGLTPELLNSFVSGIEKMNFSTRALLSMQSPGMGTGGVLSGGLRMEAAMEKGPEGMNQIVSSLRETLKRFGGPRILTREQAIENPALTRNFMIQRQLLGQVMNISDPGRQNQMLKILQDIDKGGMQQGVDGVSAINELMASGEAVANETTKAIDRSAHIIESAINSKGSELLSAMSRLANNSGVTLAINETEGIIKDLAKGDIGIEGTIDRAKRIGLEANDNEASAVRNTEYRERHNDQREQNNEVVNSIKNRLLENMRQMATIEERKKFINTGRLPKDMENITMAQENGGPVKPEEFNKILDHIGEVLRSMTPVVRENMVSDRPIERLPWPQNLTPEDQARLMPVEHAQANSLQTESVMQKTVSVNGDIDIKTKNVAIPLQINVSVVDGKLEVAMSEESQNKVVELAVSKSISEMRGITSENSIA